MTSEIAHGEVGFSHGQAPLLHERDRVARYERRDSARRADLKREVNREAGDAAVTERATDRRHHLFLARPQTVQQKDTGRLTLAIG